MFPKDEVTLPTTTKHFLKMRDQMEKNILHLSHSLYVPASVGWLFVFLNKHHVGYFFGGIT